MIIKKIGHCCLIIEVNGKKIMTDPGAWTTKQNEEENVDFILISHEHADHLHVESLKEVLSKNTNCKIITNNSVQNILNQDPFFANIYCEILEEGEESFENIILFAKTCEHADIYDGISPVLNTGYFINNELFYPGDAYLEIRKEVKILALPVAGPWAKMREVLDYAKKINPKIAFPVHDGLIKENCLGPFRNLPSKFLGEAGIEFKNLNDGETLMLD